MNFFTKIANKFVALLGSVKWSQKNTLTAEHKQQLREKLSADYYIVLTRKNNYLSTYAIAFAHFALTGKFGYWSHSLMNLEDEVNTLADFRLIEATRIGVTYAAFDDVFNINSVALLKPKHIDLPSWTLILDKAKADLGKPYDSLYNIQQDNALSCVELVRDALRALPDYDVKFAAFEQLIAKNKNLTPQMFYDCSDFEVVYEARN